MAAERDPRALSRAMNRRILMAAGRDGRQAGLLDRLRGSTPLPDDAQERLNLALSDYEQAARREDPVAAELADARIEKLLEESRAARESNVEHPETPPMGRVSFDGGVRRSATRRPQIGMNGALAQMHAERRALAEQARESA